jgi:hypothetical protein
MGVVLKGKPVNAIGGKQASEIHIMPSILIQKKFSDQTSIPYTLNSQVDEIFSQLHDVRLENASNRAEQTKLKREKLQMQAKI